MNIGQDCAEGILRKHLAECGVVSERGTGLVGFEQDEQGVTVQLLKHDGDKIVEESARFDYLVGADGARSKWLWLYRISIESQSVLQVLCARK